MPTVRFTRTPIALALLLTLPGCDPSGPLPCDGTESTTDTESDATTDSGSTDTTAGSEVGDETGSGSGESTESDTTENETGETGIAECVPEFFTCRNIHDTELVCMTCPGPTLIPCTCFDYNNEPVVCFAVDAASCG